MMLAKKPQTIHLPLLWLLGDAEEHLNEKKNPKPKPD